MCGRGQAWATGVATLSALVDCELQPQAIVPVVDPEAAEACHRMGEGTELSISIGHKLDPRWGSPRPFTGYVERLRDGEFFYSGGQWEGSRARMGPTAVLRIGSVRVIIMSRATYDWADEQIRAVGLEPAEAKFVVAKNPMNFRLAYGSIAMMILDTPGPTPATLRHVTYQKLQRPYFPADDHVPGLRPEILQGRGS